MTEYKQITRKESMALSRQDYITRCKAWLNEFNGGHPLKVKTSVECPVHIWVETNKQACGHELVANTMFCEICGEACCPDCYSHNVQQISRVTGYMGDVAGWNAGKKQEFKDRQRHQI